MSPKDLVAMDDDALHNILMDHVSALEKDYAGSYIQSIIKAVKSWLTHNRRDLKVKIKIRGADDTPSLRDERIPTKEELKRIFLSGDKKARTASVLVAHSGFRIETLGNYDGSDGLRVKDIPEMVVEGQVEFNQIPTMIIVRRELSKARFQYFTFLGEEGCEYLKDYLEERMRGGEEINSESSIITPKLRMKPFIRSINISDTIRGAIRKAGFPWRPCEVRYYSK